MKTINIEKIAKVINDFSEKRNWDQFHSIKNLSMALSVEASELVEIFQWLSEEKSNQVKCDPKLKNKVEEELADIFVYLLRISTKCDIDIEKIVLDKMKKNEEKYPVEKSFGVSKKYNEL